MHALTARETRRSPFQVLQRKLTMGLLAAAAMLPLAAPAVAQTEAEPIRIDGLHSFELRVSDVERSLEFYQGLFGAPVLNRLGDTISLQIGDGPHYFTLSPTRRDEQPHISHFALSVPNFSLFGLQGDLADHGLIRTVDTMFDGRSALELANLTWTERLPEDGDDMTTDNHHLYFADRDGIRVQLSSPDACGSGEGPQATCNLEPAPEEGLIELREINHFTTYVANYQLTNDFYRNLFGLENQAFQGTFPLLGLSDGRQFLMFVGGTQPGVGAPDRVRSDTSTRGRSSQTAAALGKPTHAGAWRRAGRHAGSVFFRP